MLSVHIVGKIASALRKSAGTTGVFSTTRCPWKSVSKKSVNHARRKLNVRRTSAGTTNVLMILWNRKTSVLHPSVKNANQMVNVPLDIATAKSVLSLIRMELQSVFLQQRKNVINAVVILSARPDTANGENVSKNLSKTVATASCEKSALHVSEASSVSLVNVGTSFAQMDLPRVLLDAQRQLHHQPRPPALLSLPPKVHHPLLPINLTANPAPTLMSVYLTNAQTVFVGDRERLSTVPKTNARLVQRIANAKQENAGIIFVLMDLMSR